VDNKDKLKFLFLFKIPYWRDWVFIIYIISVSSSLVLTGSLNSNSQQISPGQAAFDLIASSIDKDGWFDIDITDEPSRNYMFFDSDVDTFSEGAPRWKKGSGEGSFISGIGQASSGTLDLLIRLFSSYVLVFPILILRRIWVWELERNY